MRRYRSILGILQRLVYLLVVLKVPTLAVLIKTNRELLEFRRIDSG